MTTDTAHRSATRITGHRGARGLWPENSLEAFVGVGQLDVDAVEFDVHLTDFGELPVVHDPWLERTTNGSGPVRQLTPTARRQLLLNESTETLPVLTEVLDVLAASSSAALHVEIKNDESGRPYAGLVEAVLAEIDQRALRHRCHLASFDVSVLETCRQLAPDVPRLVSVDSSWSTRYGGLERFLDRANDLVDIVAIHHSLLNDNWDLVTGVIPAPRLCVWTINDADEIRAWLARGVGHLTTDRPDLALSLRSRGAE